MNEDTLGPDEHSATNENIHTLIPIEIWHVKVIKKSLIIVYTITILVYSNIHHIQKYKTVSKVFDIVHQNRLRHDEQDDSNAIS